MSKYLIRLDDIAPNMDWERYQEVIDLLDHYQVKPLLGVIPDNCDPDLLCFPKYEGDFWGVIRDRVECGYEVALHGYQHRLDSSSGGILNIHSHGEFAGHSKKVQTERMSRGLELFRRNGVETKVFMPPAHSYDSNTLECMYELGLTILTDGYALWPFWQEGILHVPQLFAMPFSAPLGVYTFCFHLNELSSDQMKRIHSFLSKQNKNFISFSEAELYVHGFTSHKLIGSLVRKTATGLLFFRSKSREKSS